LAKWAIGLVFLLLAANWIVAIGRLQVNVLYWDQWGFFTPIMEGKSWWGIFDRQHGPHRQGIAFLLTSWIMALCNWDERIDSLWICSILFLSAILALLLKLRMAGPLRAMDAWIILAILTFGQCDSVITTPNASHSAFPLLLTLTLAHSWLSKNIFLRYLNSSLCTAFLMFTGFGLFAAGVSTFFIFTVAVADLKSGRHRYSCLAFSAFTFLLTSWALFFHGYVFDPASHGFKFPWTPLSDYAEFVVLMLTAPAQWEGATVLHYAAGLVCLGFLLAITYRASRSFLNNPTLASSDSVILLLCLSSLFYCVDAAVGRVQMGVAAGLTSRYITLVTPALFGWYLWTARNRSIRHIVSYAVLWGIVACPYFSLYARPAAEWMGSLGASRWIYQRARKIADQKLTFVTEYLQTGDARLVASTAHALIFPEDSLDYLDDRLAFQRQNHLSFFAHPEKPFGYAPWFIHHYATWLSGFELEGRVRWLGKDAELELGARSEMYLNFRILEKSPSLPADAKLTVRIGDRNADMDLGRGLLGVSIPIAPGSRPIRFESAGGAFLPENGDSRNLSFLISEPELTQTPSYVTWPRDGVALAEIHEWR
jgi:hypothetical protein